MKTKQSFFPCLSALLFIIFSQGAAAHMLFNYKTAVMEFQREDSYQTENGNEANINLFNNYTFQADISFITPDINFDLEELEVATFKFINPVTSVITSGAIENAKIIQSYFWLEAWKVNGEIHTDWQLTFDVEDSNLPDDTVAQGYFTSRNNLDNVTIILHNYLYSRDSFETRLVVQADFGAEYLGDYPNDLPGLPRFSVKHITVPEPLTPALFLLGILSTVVVRRIKA